MRTIELGTTGEHVSRIALGAMGMGAAAGEEPSFALLDRFIADGGTFVDTADCYAWWGAQGTNGGQSEELLGRWLRRSGARDTVFLATKGTARLTDPGRVWPAGSQDPDWDLARQTFVGAGSTSLRESLEGSLRRLGTDRIDLYYVHVDDRTTPLEETLETLASFVTEGKVRYLGWSNVHTWRLERIRGLCLRNGWPMPVALQQQHSYLQRRVGLVNASIVDDEQLDYLRSHRDLTLVAYSPVLKGLYDTPAEQREQLWTYEPYAGEPARARLAAVDQVAGELGVRPSQVVLAWLLAQDSPQVVPLIGTTRLQRYEEALAALDITLDPHQLATLDGA
ncbi:aldo/keto reductase [Cellulomonas sp. KRMCY2]|uniref:aldo/keto reductase n=1 Tax=Cellulomonas sp. KRMCY2 TaxID=1304865 RepID=UPI00045EAC97|nr:aldo/keto reductase [Cellulomonas sp. KRMCY2]